VENCRCSKHFLIRPLDAALKLYYFTLPNTLEWRPQESVELRAKTPPFTPQLCLERFKSKLGDAIAVLKQSPKCAVFKTEAEILAHQHQTGRTYLKKPFPVNPADINLIDMIWGDTFSNGGYPVRQSRAEKREPNGSRSESPRGSRMAPMSGDQPEISTPPLPLDLVLTDGSLIDQIKRTRRCGHFFSSDKADKIIAGKKNTVYVLLQLPGAGKTKESIDLALEYGYRTAWLAFHGPTGVNNAIGRLFIQTLASICKSTGPMVLDPQFEQEEKAKLNKIDTAVSTFMEYFCKCFRIAVLSFPEDLEARQVLALQMIPAISSCIASFIIEVLSCGNSALENFNESHLNKHKYALVVDEAPTIANARILPAIFARRGLNGSYDANAMHPLVNTLLSVCSNYDAEHFVIGSLPADFASCLAVS
jgi:hypothetical protein